MNRVSPSPSTKFLGVGEATCDVQVGPEGMASSATSLRSLSIVGDVAELTMKRMASIVGL
jgi:hypothetical protein